VDGQFTERIVFEIAGTENYVNCVISVANKQGYMQTIFVTPIE
jgi:hypothetical protein